MSYDLGFRKKNKEQLTTKEFEDYFLSRPNYEVANGQAIYGNEDTGVYFIFENYEPGQVVEPVDSDGDDFFTSLTLNFVRPHIFALECEPEVRAFVEHFDFQIQDTQNEGNKTEVYDTEAFFRGYNFGNKFSYKSILNQSLGAQSFTLPAEVLERHWRWNFHRNELQESLDEDIFVPKISYQKLNGELKSYVVWTDAIPAMFPEVDAVVVYRMSLAPSTLFRKKQDYLIKDFSEILPFLGDKTPEGFRKLAFAEKVQKWVKSLPTSKQELDIVTVDKVLDRELMPD